MSSGFHSQHALQTAKNQNSHFMMISHNGILHAFVPLAFRVCCTIDCAARMGSTHDNTPKFPQGRTQPAVQCNSHGLRTAILKNLPPWALMTRACSLTSWSVYGGFPRTGLPFLGGPIKGILSYLGNYSGTPSLRNTHICAATLCLSCRSPAPYATRRSFTVAVFLPRRFRIVSTKFSKVMPLN